MNKAEITDDALRDIIYRNTPVWRTTPIPEEERVMAFLRYIWENHPEYCPEVEEYSGMCHPLEFTFAVLEYVKNMLGEKDCLAGLDFIYENGAMWVYPNSDIFKFDIDLRKWIGEELALDENWRFELWRDNQKEFELYEKQSKFNESVEFIVGDENGGNEPYRVSTVMDMIEGVVNSYFDGLAYVYQKFKKIKENK